MSPSEPEGHSYTCDNHCMTASDERWAGLGNKGGVSGAITFNLNTRDIVRVSLSEYWGHCEGEPE